MEKLWLIHSLHKMQMKAQCKKSIAKSESSSLNGRQQRDPQLPQEIQETNRSRMFPKLELSKRNPKKASGLHLKLRSLRDHRQLQTTKHRFPRRHQFPLHQTIMEISMILSRLENKLKSKRRKAWEIQIIRRMLRS